MESKREVIREIINDLNNPKSKTWDEYVAHMKGKYVLRNYNCTKPDVMEFLRYMESK